MCDWILFETFKDSTGLIEARPLDVSPSEVRSATLDLRDVRPAGR